MVVGLKDTVKLIGISIISCCAIFVCTMFMNFYIDIILIEDLITSPQTLILYHAMCSSSKITSVLSGSCLLLTSIIMLIFYIKHYIDTHKKELGILKALGYSNLTIAKNFWVFGFSVLIGTALGYGGAFFAIPSFYELQNKDHILPEITIHFHASLFFYFVILPPMAFSVLSIIYAYFKLKKPTIALLKEIPSLPNIKKTPKNTVLESSFTNDLKKCTLKSKKSLIFFILFASFCFSSMTQMSASMKDLSSEMMGIMMLVIGIILAFTMLFLAITTVINGNTKTIAMMQVFGYSQKDCCKSILSGYRALSYIGFVIGTGYQYLLLRLTVDIVFKDFPGIPTYQFDVTAMVLSLCAFIVVYELLMFFYAQKIKNISLKEIMLET